MLDDNASIIPEDVLKSAEQIETYRALLGSVDTASKQLRETRNTMDGVDEVVALEETLRTLETQVKSRDELLASHGPAFQKWFQDITRLLSGFDILEAEDVVWNGKKEEVDTLGEADVSKTLADTTTLPVLTDVVEPATQIIDIDLGETITAPLTMEDISAAGMEVSFTR